MNDKRFDGRCTYWIECRRSCSPRYVLQHHFSRPLPTISPSPSLHPRPYLTRSPQPHPCSPPPVHAHAHLPIRTRVAHVIPPCATADAREATRMGRMRAPTGPPLLPVPRPSSNPRRGAHNGRKSGQSGRPSLHSDHAPAMKPGTVVH